MVLEYFAFGGCFDGIVPLGALFSCALIEKLCRSVVSYIGIEQDRRIKKEDPKRGASERKKNTLAFSLICVGHQHYHRNNLRIAQFRQQ